jgi:hypothetical protein
MSNTYFESTGLLHFRGPAKLTPLLHALFEPLNLDTDEDLSGTGDSRYIARTYARSGEWADVLENLAELADERGLPEAAGADIDAGDPTAGLRRLAIERSVPADKLTPILDAATNLDTAHLADLYQLAQLLNDGHNLRAISAEGCWHADRALLGEFGGYGVYRSAAVACEGDSTQVVMDAAELDAALAGDDHEAAVTTLTKHLTRACSMVLDRDTRVAVTRLLLDRLIEDRSWQSI